MIAKSDGRKSLLETAPLVADSMAAQYSAGTEPRLIQAHTAFGLTPTAVASAFWEPRIADALSTDAAIDVQEDFIATIYTCRKKKSTGVGNEFLQEWKNQDMNMGARIEELLKQRDMKQVDLLKKVPELDAKALSAAINRDSRFNEFALEIAEALGVSLEYLLFGVDRKSSVASSRQEDHRQFLPTEEACELLHLYGSCGNDGRTIILNTARSLVEVTDTTLNQRKS